MQAVFQDLSTNAQTHTLIKDALFGRDGGELFLEDTKSESLRFEDSVLKEATHSQNKGFGLRALAGECTLYAHSPHFTIEALKDATQTLRSLSTNRDAIAPISVQTSIQPIQKITQTQEVNFAHKVELLRQMDLFARALDPHVVQVSLSLGYKQQNVLIQRPDCEAALDQRTYATLVCMITLDQDGRREYGYATLGRRCEQDFFKEDVWQSQLKEALRRARIAIQSIPAPAGTMPVVLGNGITGILLHEAVGHGLEADFNRKGHSLFSTQMDKQVASPLVTVIDDGRQDIALGNNHGSLRIDDEGTSTQETVLIEKGVMRNHMSDQLNAHLMAKKSSGNGRRQSYAHTPMPRMTNTYMAKGTSNVHDMIRSTNKGIYAVGFNGGQVDIVSGNFVFAMSEAYLIENGQIGAPIKGATLIGNGPEVMKKISMVGDDLKLDPGVGYCGKNGQTALVGLGQPSCLISEMTVGGTHVG